MRSTKNFAGMSDPARNSQFGRRWQEESSDSEGLQAIGKVAHKVMVNTAVQAVEHWLRQADALKGKDRRLKAYAIESLRRTDPETLKSVLTHELLENLIKKQLRVKHRLFRDRVMKVLAAGLPRSVRTLIFEEDLGKVLVVRRFSLDVLVGAAR